MTQIVQMCNAFASLGHTVTLLVTDRKTDIQEEPEEYFDAAFQFKVVRISVIDIIGFITKVPKPLRPYFFHIQRLMFYFGAKRYLKRQPADLLYGRDEWLLLHLHNAVGIPVLWESHEAKFSRTARKLLEKTKKVIVISEGIRDRYIEEGIKASWIHVAHDAVDERFFKEHIPQSESRKALGIQTEKPVVLYIGGLEDWKGVETLLKAGNNAKEYEVYIIGGKKHEIAEYRRIYPNVKFLGPRPYKELSEHQQVADILVIPNTAKTELSARYTSPLKLFAYMTSKKPIVAARIPSIENVLSDQECFFFTADNPSSLNGTILEVLSDMNEGRVKAQKAYEKSRYYTWRERAKNILNHLNT